jgi:UTP-glucose-1-phosphate uridylyltransferase
MLTVFMPCAGAGTRLSVPLSKEIMPIDFNRSLIDFCFDHFKSCDRTEVRFVLTITKDKTDLVRYVSKYAKKFNIIYTYFNEDYNEFPGSIRSAMDLFTEKNIILLPDSFMKYDSVNGLYQDVMHELDHNQCVIFFKESNSNEYKKSKGCIKVSSDSRLVDYVDKPESADYFDGVWCSIAFVESSLNSILSAIEASTFKHDSKEKIFQTSRMMNAKCIAVSEYIDLGTWDDLKRFWQRG